jgi:hypothetical protein
MHRADPAVALALRRPCVLCTDANEVIDRVQPGVYATALTEDRDDLAVTAATLSEFGNQRGMGFEFRTPPHGRQRVENGANGLVHWNAQISREETTGGTWLEQRVV